MKTKILYEDTAVLVCYKPPGLAVQTARIGQQDMVSELKNYLAEQGIRKANGKGNVQNRKPESRQNVQPYLGVVHRLDQPVEGLLVFAKTKEAAGKLSSQLSEGILNKHYYGVLCGKPSEETGELVDYLGKDSGTGRAVVYENPECTVLGSLDCNSNGGERQQGKQRDDSQPKKAVLQYRILETLLPETTFPEASLADIHIDTGRFHQIRAQMAHGGMPLLGDSKYGTEESGRISRELGIKTVALCACHLSFSHPVSGKHMSYHIVPEGRAFSFFTQDLFDKN